MGFTNTLYYGDNLDVLKKLSKKDPFVDLIYIDPPFNSKKNYNILYKDLIASKENGTKVTALKEAFKDTWSNVEIGRELEELKKLDNLRIYQFLQGNRGIFGDDQMSYLTMMALRIYYMKKVLKETGSFYLHCDPTMSHYLKVLLDLIFGRKHFRNEIVWAYRRWTAGNQNFQKMHDIILRYTQSETFCFNLQYEAYGDWIKKDYGYIDEESGKRWRWHTVKGKRYKVFLEDENQGVKLNDVWQIPPIGSTAKERLGYPTQKPIALLERIIKASSNTGDVVADFFCGCGTTVAAAEKLNRKWLGVDISHLAIGLIEDKRLKPLKKSAARYVVKGFPNDLAEAEKLAREKPFEFENWIVEYKLHGHGTKKTGDGGFDGHLAFDLQGRTVTCVIEVKGGGSTVKNVREFHDVMVQQGADMGLFVCFEKKITREMRKYCDARGFVTMGHQGTDRQKQDTLGNVLTIKKLGLLSVEALLANEYPHWLYGYMVNQTYS